MYLHQESANEININLAKRIRAIRRGRKISQKALSTISGVSHGSIKRFENTGKISLISLTKIAMALGCGNDIRELFIKTEIATKEKL